MPLGAFRLNTLSAAMSGTPSLALTFMSSSSRTNVGSGATSASFVADVGDIIVYAVTASTGTTSAAPALVIPSGFDMFYNLATGTQANSMRTCLFYQISTTSGSRTLTSLSGTRSSHLIFVYKPNVTLSRVSFTPGSSEITNATPSNQTLTFGTMTSAMVAFAYGANTTTGTAAGTLTSTTTPTTAVLAFTSVNNNVARLMSFDGSGFSGTSTISKTDLGTNSMFSTVMTATADVSRSTSATWTMGAGSISYVTGANLKFGTAASAFGGTLNHGRLTVNPLDSTFYFNGNKAWTVEFWNRRSNQFINSGQGQTFSIIDDLSTGGGNSTNGSSWMGFTEGEAFNASTNRAYIGNTNYNMPSNADTAWLTYNHYAFVCYGNGTASLFVNGSQVINRVAWNNTNNSRTVRMGQAATTNTQGSSWYYDEMRVSSIARYHDSFSVATAAFTNDANTMALMHFNSNTTDDTA